jgi:hypothetical protein
MFTIESRQKLRERLLERADDDGRVAGAAITGSGACAEEDRWSDIDLFFGVAEGFDVSEVLADWSAFVYRELGALHHFDLFSGSAVYRVFLLPGLLEVDLAFTPAARFGPLGAGLFKVVFGTPVARRPSEGVNVNHLAGLGWHHVLHARICIERGKPWQAEYWIHALRNHVLALASQRFDLPVDYAKGADQLPPEIQAPWTELLVRALEPDELNRALCATAQALLAELRHADGALAETLRGPFAELARVPAR